jgi:hypothetical protein
LEKNVLANHDRNLERRADFVMKEMEMHKKKLMNA